MAKDSLIHPLSGGARAAAVEGTYRIVVLADEYPDTKVWITDGQTWTDLGRPPGDARLSLAGCTGVVDEPIDLQQYIYFVHVLTHDDLSAQTQTLWERSWSHVGWTDWRSIGNPAPGSRSLGSGTDGRDRMAVFFLNTTRSNAQVQGYFRNVSFRSVARYGSDERWMNLAKPSGTTFNDATRGTLLMHDYSYARLPDVLIANGQELWALNRRSASYEWERFGAPQGTASLGADFCACVTDEDSTALRKHNVFLSRFDRSSDSSSLWVGQNMHSDQSGYGNAQWIELGNPTGQAGLELASQAAAASANHVFVRTIARDPAAVRIWLVSGRDDVFRWTDLGTPNGRMIIRHLGAVRTPWPAVLVSASDQHVWMNRLSQTGNSWEWTDLGRPSAL